MCALDATVGCTMSSSDHGNHSPLQLSVPHSSSAPPTYRVHAYTTACRMAESTLERLPVCALPERLLFALLAGLFHPGERVVAFANGRSDRNHRWVTFCGPDTRSYLHIAEECLTHFMKNTRLRIAGSSLNGHFLRCWPAYHNDTTGGACGCML